MSVLGTAATIYRTKKLSSINKRCLMTTDRLDQENHAYTPKKMKGSVHETVGLMTQQDR